MCGRVFCSIAILAVLLAGAPQRSAPIGPPFGPKNQLVSPDGKYALFGDDKAAQLWLDDTSTHQRRMVVNVTVQTLTLAWSPDSAAFIANDRAASDRETAYLYDARTLDRVDLSRRILNADSEASRFIQTRNSAPHSYFHALRWLDARRVEVQLHGHTNGTWDGTSVRPGDCFDLRYRVSRDGVVRKLSQRVFPISNQQGCAGAE